MPTIDEQLSQHRIIPVVKLEHAESAQPLADALVAGGLPIAEITLRTGCALDAIQQLAARDDILIGAGTVLNKKQCKQAIAAGAKFIVSPGFDKGMVEYCIKQNMPVYPGVATASEIQKAHKTGVRTMKFFPAEANGGIKALKALAGPFHQIQFIPTGGINADNAKDYLRHSFVTAIGGSWMVKPDLIDGCDYATITQLAKAATELK